MVVFVVSSEFCKNDPVANKSQMACCSSFSLDRQSFRHAHLTLAIGMSSANSYLSSTAYHASNARYASPSSSSSPSASSFNIRSANIQQPLNDLNSTRSSTSSCSTSHCLSNQCIECTTILSTRPSPSPRGHPNNYVDQSSTESQ